MCKARTSHEIELNTTTVVHLKKESPHDRLGLSFAPDTADAPARVVQITAIQPNGKAMDAGLLLGDIVLSINGKPPQSSLEAAKLLRDSCGDIWLCIERPEPPNEAGDGVGEREGDGESEEDVLETARQDLEDLDFLLGRLKEHEGNLIVRHDETAMQLEAAMKGAEAEPPALLEEEMHNSEKVAAYMVAMGAYSTRQKLQLMEHAETVEANQVLSRQLSEVAQIKRWLEDTAAWLTAEMEVFAEQAEEGDVPPMLSEEDIEYMELVDEQLCELLDGPLEGEGEAAEGEEGGEVDLRLLEQQPPPPGSPTAAPLTAAASGELADSRGSAPAGAVEPADKPRTAHTVKRSSSFSRPKGEKLAQKIDDPVSTASVKRSNSFSRRGKGSAAQPQGGDARSPVSAKCVARTASFSLRSPGAGASRKTFGEDVMDGTRRAGLIAQRLQRARRGRADTGVDVDENDEVGCLVHPL
mmetsp:Transcript_42235/g.105202  ORF Transcript_42235/g.105202 Transcript_42235/m.105202 type:complete len:469 (-) Transcript_42235:458-1864(-)